MSSPEDFPPGYHLGHLVLKYFRLYADRVCQIDAATGKEESYESVLKRSILLAKALRAFGLRPGDVLAIGGFNHLDICIPFFAALFNGLPIIGVDPYFKYVEVQTLFELTRPKIAFCQNESCNIYAKAAADLGLDLKLVTFDDGDCTVKKFNEVYSNLDSVDDFVMAEFDLEKIYAFLISTSGTCGKVKVAAFKHTIILKKLDGLKELLCKDITESSKKSLLLSPINWISNYFTHITVPMEGNTNLQTSNPDNFDHVLEIINKYKPASALFSPALMASILNRKDEVDLTCFEHIAITGSKLHEDVLTEFKKLLNKHCLTLECYGQTEMLGPVLFPNPFGPMGNCGKPTNSYSVKLVDPDTGVEIKEASVTGELYIKGNGFSEYYNDPEETANAFTDDGFFKTGDLLYRDTNNNYYFVERIKTLIKYRNSHVIPSELEEIIIRHPGVREVCVIGIKDPVDGQRPVACVVKRAGSEVTAQEIKDLVASNLSKNKELRGGVVFLDSLPYTSSGKIARIKLCETVTSLKRE